jgi:D-lactate dehydrogenase
MSIIQFFDTTERDKQQILSVFGESASAHTLIFEPGEVSIDTLNREADVLSMFVNSTVNQDILDAMPNLRIIACRSTGFNNVSLDIAKERGITVCNVPTYGEHTVAEYAFGLLLSLTRRLPLAIEHATKETPYTALSGTDLFGKTIGVIGSGRIGQQSARIARGFDMNVIAYDPYPNQSAAEQIGFKYVSLEELLAASDVITVHAPYTQENHHLLKSERLSLVKSGVYLINTARGELVETKALIEGLESGRIAGTALDVVEGEQLLDGGEEYLLLRSNNDNLVMLEQNLEIDILLKHPNAIVTKHNAFNTVEAVDRINATTVENIKSFMSGNPTNVVS